MIRIGQICFFFFRACILIPGVTVFFLLTGIQAAFSGDSFVTIGVPTSLESMEGRESLMAVTLAAEEINRNGGVQVSGLHRPIRIIPVDLNDAAPDVRVEKALGKLDSFLKNTPVHALVVGPFRSEVLLPALDMISRAKVPLIGTIAMTPALESKIMKNPQYRYAFRTGLNTRYLTDYLIETMRFLNSRFGFTKVFIMSQDVAWARSATSLMVKLYFERSGWQITGMETYSSDTSDFSSGLESAAASGAHVILPIFDAPDSGNLVTQWKSMEIPCLICGFISPMMGPSAWERFGGRIGGALNLVFEIGNVPSSKYPPAAEFYNAFKQRFSREIEAGHGPAPAYEAVYVLAQAIEDAGSLDPDNIVDALESIDRKGVMGRLRFHRGHQVIFGSNPDEEALACLVQWSEAGERVIVYPPAVAEDEIRFPGFFDPARMIPPP